MNTNVLDSYKSLTSADNKLYNKSHIKKNNTKQEFKTNKRALNIDYSSSWFETENNLSISDYLRLLFTLSHKHFESNCEKDTVKGIIVPHAGLKYSGLCAATAYYALRHRKTHIKRAILLCTNHNEKDIIITSCSTVNSYTGLGSNPIEIDTKIMQRLEPYTTINNDIFEKEHSFFIQLPFIEAITHKCKLIPLLIGNIIFDKTNIARIYKIFEILIEILKDEHTVIICTSDLSHVNGHFPTKVNSYIYHSIRSKDSEMLKFIYNKLNGTKGKRGMDIIEDISELNNTASCGMFAMYLFAKLLNLYNRKHIIHSTSSSSSSSSTSSTNSTSLSRSKSNTLSFDSSSSNESINSNIKIKKTNLYTHTLCYYTSMQCQHIDTLHFNPYQLMKTIDISNIELSSVSYASIAITTQPYINNKATRKLANLLSNFEKMALLTFAREQLFNTLVSSTGKNNSYNSGHIPNILLSPIYCQVFQCNLGVFVTIYKNNGELRGCIGTTDNSNDIDNIHTIETNVSRYVKESALHDSRFTPMNISEYNNVNLSITILNTIKYISINDYFGDLFVLGRDGILVKNGSKSGFFLPSVAKAFNYDKKMLIEELCVNKMNMPHNCYVTGNSKLFYNEGYEISEQNENA